MSTTSESCSSSLGAPSPTSSEAIPGIFPSKPSSAARARSACSRFSAAEGPCIFHITTCLIIAVKRSGALDRSQTRRALELNVPELLDAELHAAGEEQLAIFGQR